jgi:hypothetical protein
VSPEDCWLLGFQWDSYWWFDKFLPFGPRTSPYLFDLFSSGLKWMLQHYYGWEALLHYLDKFLNIVSGSHTPKKGRAEVQIASWERGGIKAFVDRGRLLLDERKWEMDMEERKAERERGREERELQRERFREELEERKAEREFEREKWKEEMALRRIQMELTLKRLLGDKDKS